MTAGPDWIDEFVTLSEYLTCPEIFRRWSAIGTIAAALDRKCVAFTPQALYPNLFITLIGKPGVGKSATLSLIRRLVQNAATLKGNNGNFTVSPVDMTREFMLDQLADDSCMNKLEVNGKVEEYHTLFLLIAELGVFIKAHDLHMLSTLCALYDCDLPSFEEGRRGRGDKLEDKVKRIPNPQINLLCGVTPGDLAEKFPIEAWSMGFMARNLLIYSGEVKRPTLFGETGLDKSGEDALSKSLSRISNLSGEFRWTKDAQERIQAWINAGYPPKPDHPRLTHYCTRRLLQILKLSMVFRAASLEVRPKNSHLIETEDLQKAFDVLFEAEDAMPGIFLEMSGRSDKAVIDDAHAYFFMYQARGDGQGRPYKNVHKQRVHNYLSNKVPAWQVKQIIETMISSGLADEVGGQPDKIIFKAKQLLQ